MSNSFELFDDEVIPAKTDDKPSAVGAKLVSESQRLSILPKLFGERLMILGENTVYNQMGAMCPEYHGGFWDYYLLPNGGHYMVPTGCTQYQLSWDMNGFSGTVSADAAGLIVTLIALSHMSFKDRTDTCAENFHKIRDLLHKHPEASLIFQAID